MKIISTIVVLLFLMVYTQFTDSIPITRSNVVPDNDQNTDSIKVEFRGTLLISPPLLAKGREVTDPAIVKNYESTSPAIVYIKRYGIPFGGGGERPWVYELYVRSGAKSKAIVESIKAANDKRVLVIGEVIFLRGESQPSPPKFPGGISDLPHVFYRRVIIVDSIKLLDKQ